MTLRTALEQGTSLLEEASIGVPRLTAEVLLAHAIGRDRVYLFTWPEEELSELGWIHYGRYLHQRLQGVPTQHITKRQEFYGRNFVVSPDVLIPRPETEHVVTAVLEFIPAGATIVDVGTGSGAIAATIMLESGARTIATDISEPALRVAAKNCTLLGAVVSFICTDLLEGLRPASADVVVSNPPYVGLLEASGLQREVVAHEPHIALFAGEDGNAIYQRLIADAPRVLRPNGFLVLELGWRSLDAVRAMMGPGWTDVRTAPDLAGIPRVLAAKWQP